ncbi:hypothetical protein [Catellatospora methionotrophica]|uniref:hypothetical protein n=1 Tax=Catellatospora methionotrophica TaxID=121620 RepID=UPI0033E7DBFE
MTDILTAVAASTPGCTGVIGPVGLSAFCGGTPGRVDMDMGTPLLEGRVRAAADEVMRVGACGTQHGQVACG